MLRQVDDHLRLTEWFSGLLPDERRDDRVVHDRQEQIRQRVYQIAAGYEDCNDADTLRGDPLLKTVCDRSPSDPQGLSSQPTLTRLENSVDARTIKKLLLTFEQKYVDELPEDTDVVVLDIDSTDDETHGTQQLSFFHGFYDHHMYHPFMVFDGTSGQLISMLLRPGNTHSGRAVLPLLCRLIRAIKARFPDAQIVVRGDSGFCLPRILDGLEQLETELGDVDYIFGIAKNKVLLRLGQPAIDEAERRFERTGRHLQHFSSFEYAAKTWSHLRHVVIKAERHIKGPNPRFVVTSLKEFPAHVLYHAYIQRARCELYIKDFKNALMADRLSCHSFIANFFRLLLHALAYRLMLGLRQSTEKVAPKLGRSQFDTLRLRLLKIAAQIKESARRILVRLPAAFPYASVFRAIATGLDPPLATA